MKGSAYHVCAISFAILSIYIYIHIYKGNATTIIASRNKWNRVSPTLRDVAKKFVEIPEDIFPVISRIF